MTYIDPDHAEGIAKENRQLQGRLRKLLRESGHEGPLEIQYIRRGGRGRLVGAVVFDEESDVPMILVVDHGNWHWVM